MTSKPYSLEELASTDDTYLTQSLPTPLREHSLLNAKETYRNKIKKIINNNSFAQADLAENSQIKKIQYDEWLREVGISDTTTITKHSLLNSNGESGALNLSLTDLAAEIDNPEQQVDELVEKLHRIEEQDAIFREKKLKSELLDAKYPPYVNKTSPKSYINNEHNKILQEDVSTEIRNFSNNDSTTYSETHHQTAMNDRVEYIHEKLYQQGDKKHRHERDILHTSFANVFLHPQKAPAETPPPSGDTVGLQQKPDGSPYYDGAGKELKDILKARRRKSESINSSSLPPHDNLPIAPKDVDNESAVDVLARAKKEMLNIVEQGDIPVDTLLHTDLQATTSTQLETTAFSGRESHIINDEDAQICSIDTNDLEMNEDKYSSSQDVATQIDTLNNQVDAPDTGNDMRLNSSTSSFLVPPPHSPPPMPINLQNSPNLHQTAVVPSSETFVNTVVSSEHPSIDVKPIVLGDQNDDAISELAKRAHDFVQTSRATVSALAPSKSDGTVVDSNLTSNPKILRSTTCSGEGIDRTNTPSKNNMLHGIEDATATVHSQNDRIKLSTSTLNPVELWQRRVKAQEQALKEAEDALERAEGEIRLATEVRQRKGGEMEEGLGENQPHSRPSLVDRVKYKSPYMRKSFTRDAGDSTQEDDSTETEASDRETQAFGTMSNGRASTSSNSDTSSSSSDDSTSTSGTGTDFEELASTRKRRKSRPKASKSEIKKRKKKRKFSARKYLEYLQHKKRKKKRKKRRQKLKNRQRNIAGHADSAAQDESITGDEVEHYKSPRAGATVPNDHTPMKSFDEFLQSNMDTSVPENNLTPECTDVGDIAPARLQPIRRANVRAIPFTGPLLQYKQKAIELSKKYEQRRLQNDQSKMKNLMSIKLKAIERHKRKQKRSKAACAIQQWWTSRVMPRIRLWQEKKLKKKFDEQLQMLGSSQGDNKRNLQGCDGTVQDATKLGAPDTRLPNVQEQTNVRSVQLDRVSTAYEKLRALVKGYIVRLMLFKLPRSLTLIKTIQDSRLLLKGMGNDDPLYQSIHRQLISEKRELHSHLDSVRRKGIGIELRKLRESKEKMLLYTSQQSKSNGKSQRNASLQVSKRSSRLVQMGAKARERMKAYNLKLKVGRERIPTGSTSGGNSSATDTETTMSSTNTESKEMSMLKSPTKDGEEENETSSLVWLKEAFGFPPISSTKQQPNSLGVEVVSAQNLTAASHIYKDRAQNRDPYAILTLERKRVHWVCRKTKAQKRTLDPNFNAMFLFKLAWDDLATLDDFVLHVELRDNDRFNKQTFLGMITVPLKSILPIEGAYDANSDERVVNCDFTKSLEKRALKDVVRGTIRLRMKLMAFEPVKDVNGGLVCSRRNVRKPKRGLAASPSDEHTLDSTQNARSESVKANSADRSRNPAVNLDVPRNIQNKKPQPSGNGSKRNGNRVGKKLDWSHVKSRTDCHLRRKPAMRATTKYNDFIGGKIGYPSKLPWNVIDEETGSSEYEQYRREKTLQINTSLNSPNKLNITRRSKSFRRSHGKRQNNISFAGSPDDFGDTHVRKTPFERYQRGAGSPPVEGANHSDSGVGTNIPSALNIYELSELLQKLSDADRRLLEQDEELDFNTTMPPLDRREFFKSYDDRTYEAETMRLKKEYIALGGAGVSPMSPV